MQKNHCEAVCKIGICLLFINLFWSCNKKQESDIPLGKVTQGTFYLEIYEEGDVEAVRSVDIIAPRISWRYGNLKITQIIKDGTDVKAGDTLIVFDAAEVKKGVVEAEARLGMNRAELERMIAQQQSDLEELKSDYEVARISQEISKIQFESAGYEANVKKKQIELNLEKANISLARAKEQINNRIKIQKEELKQKNLSINQDVNELKEANNSLNKLFLISPAPGIAIINKSWSTGNKFQIGDQCWSGFPLIQLPDLRSLKVITKINEVDIAKIKKGLRVEIKPDAFSDSVYVGEVSSVANLAINKEGNSKIKVFPVEILLKGASKKLLPGLTVSNRIIVGTINNALSVPLVALHSVGADDYVFRKKGNGFEKIKVETGVSNSDHIVITKGLELTDKVALTDPTVVETKKDAKNKNENEKQK